MELENKLLFPILLSLLFAGTIAVFTPLLGHAIPLNASVALPAFTFPFFLSGIMTTKILESKIRKTGVRLLEAVLLSFVWTGFILLLHDRAFHDFSLAEESSQLLLVYIAAPLLSRRIAEQWIKHLHLPYLVIAKKEQLGRDFADWAHNYMQSHSIRSAMRTVRRKVILFLLLLTAATVAGNELIFNYSVLFRIAALIAIAAALIILSLLYRTEVYCRWILNRVQVSRDFFRIWRRFTCITITLAVLCISLLPLRMEIMDRKKIWTRLTVLLTHFTRSGGRRTASPTAKKITEDTRKKLEALKNREPILKRLLRIALYGMLVYLVAAVAGLILKKVFRYRRLPRSLGFFVALAFPLEQFLMIFTAVLRLLFFPFKRKRANFEHPLQNRLEQMFPDIEELSDAKKEEIRKIISVYLRFLEASELRGYRLGTGETPDEFRKRIARGIHEIEKPSGDLTEGFYICRYSRETAGKNILRTAEKDLQRCLKILNKYEITG